MKKFLRKHKSKIVIAIFFIGAIVFLYNSASAEASLAFEEMTYMEYRDALHGIKITEVLSVGFLISGIAEIRNIEEQRRLKEDEYDIKNLELEVFSKFSKIIDLRLDASDEKQEMLNIRLKEISFQLENLRLQEDVRELKEIHQDLKEEAETLIRIQNDLKLTEKELRQDQD